MRDTDGPPIILDEESGSYEIVRGTIKRKLAAMFPDFGLDDPDNVLPEYIQVPAPTPAPPFCSRSCPAL